MEKQFISHSRNETICIGRRVAEAIGTGVIALYGELGSGKTVFVKGIASALGVREPLVTSPTFKILNISNGRKKLYHIDAYRLSSGDELLSAVGDVLEQTDCIIAIEWAEHVKTALPSSRLDVELSHLSENARRITFRPCNITFNYH